MYEELINKQVKLIFKDGMKIGTKKGVFLDFDDLNYKIDVDGKSIYFKKEDVSRIEELQVVLESGDNDEYR